MRNLVIIGAGVAGLVAGVYAQRSGFHAVILERGATPGGVSTSWKRKGYFFEGGIHWLIGATKGMPLNDLWREVGALSDNNPVFFKDPIYTLVDDEGSVALYRDLSKLSKAFPADRLMLGLMRFEVWCYTFFHPVVQDAAGLKCRYPRRFHPLEFIKMTPALLLAPFLMCQSVRGYLRRFSNPRLRNLLSAVVNDRINALSFIYTLSSFVAGDSGYPKGGSLRMACNVASRFKSLGGEIRYHTPALQVLRAADGTVTGVRTETEDIPADAVIISADARSAIDRLFPTPLQDGWARRMRRNLRTAQCMFFGVGIHSDLSAYPRSMQVPLKEPFVLGDCSLNSVIINNYAREPQYAPEGCTTLTMVIPGIMYNYWKQAHQDGTYYARKAEVTATLLAIIERVIPEIAGRVDVTDLATPVTYERYCDTFEGSYMTDWLPWRLTPTAPVRYSRGLYFAGQRTSLSGGLPIAGLSARKAVQALCKDFQMEFVSR